MTQERAAYQPELFDIFDYASPPFWHTKTFIIIMIVIFLTVIISSYYLWKKYKERAVSPENWVLDQLVLLDSQEYKTRKEFQFFYITLTKIIKQYLARRFFWKTADKTDEELLTLLEDKNFNQELLAKLRVTLNGASRIKFSHEEAIALQMTADKQTVKELIQFVTVSLEREKKEREKQKHQQKKS